MAQRINPYSFVETFACKATGLIIVYLQSLLQILQLGKKID